MNLRTKVLRYLYNPRTSKEISEVFEISRSSAKGHLHRLINDGKAVKVDKEGRFNKYINVYLNLPSIIKSEDDQSKSERILLNHIMELKKENYELKKELCLIKKKMI